MVVPARAGMSPVILKFLERCDRGPRASGDEPISPENASLESLWSPRERG